MPLTITYALASSATPAVRAPSSSPADLLDPTVAEPAPVVAHTWATGASPNMAADLNGISARVDNLGRYGGGGYAIVDGLVLREGTGLQAIVGTGVASSDGHQVETAERNQALTGGVTSYLWQLRTGALSVVIGSLAAPSATAVYLGRIVTDGSAPTAIDGSGVVYRRPGGLLYRRTGDAAAPDDSPPANLLLLTRTADGLWLWDGAGHRLISDQLPLSGGTLTGLLVLANAIGLQFGNDSELVGEDVSGFVGRVRVRPVAGQANSSPVLSAIPRGVPQFDGYGATNIGAFLELAATDVVADAVNFLRMMGFAGSDRVGFVVEKGGTGTLVPFIVRMGASDRFQIGAAGELSFPNLPTADPHFVGQVWSNAGVLTVSAG
jgi:hypothetical protein